MNDLSSKVSLFIDNTELPVAELKVPVQFEIDTRKLTDGEHTLTIVSKSPTGKEGIKKLHFTVRNGPAITLEGLKDHEIVDGVVPLLINAYDKGDQKTFLIEGSETPHGIPNWFWLLLTSFTAWAIFYLIINLKG